MIVITSIAEMQSYCGSVRRRDRSLSFVPTMGALHRGHLSLCERARSKADVVAASIFVNPTQFGPKEDFSRYPRTLEADAASAETAGCDVLFAPPVEEMYPSPYYTYVAVEELGSRLCGVTRPTHFRGVATVVLKLFHIIVPDVAVFGQKDAQQVIIIKRMVKDLNLPLRIEVCPTVRERDGLAMSSRNAYLTPDERSAAPSIHQGLRSATALFERGEINAGLLKQSVEKAITGYTPLLSIEYIEIVDTATLVPLNEVKRVALLAVACRTKESNTRLIDNIILGGSL
ncbi:MAG: pantoate--beta-alanine ligase [Chitinispirillaceae bacterium]|nr:pantoate--beta-alanine ligase [Chitinispirillaceae bacterium]